MLKERFKLISKLAMALDFAVLSVAFFLAYYIRFGQIYASQENAPINQYVPVFSLSVIIWIWLLSVNGVYRSFRGKPFNDLFTDLLQGTCFSAGVFGAVIFFLKVEFVSRGFFMFFVVLGFALLLAEKWCMVLLSRSIRRTGYNYRQILLVGTGPRAGRFVELLTSHPEWGFRLIGLVDDEEERMNSDFFGVNVIGTFKDIPRILREKVVDEVVFVVPRKWLEKVQEFIALCELQGIKASVAADIFDLKIAQAKQTDLAGFPLLSFETTKAVEWQLMVKRAIDLALSGAGLLVLAPFLLAVAAAVKITSPGPVLFKQKRVGLHGRIFTLYKFRSMVPDAQKKQAELLYLNEMDGPVFKIKDDPRITPMGKFLRRTSIDELPQLWNVLVGHMSLIGPRPPVPEEVEKYETWQIRRLSMRPGITCLWQISGRNEINFRKWMELDLEYIDSWSLLLDLKIFLRTIPAVLFGAGAR
jgi:exopolysaccharide biosynthesis polyprenyl glycosylphosphotransferase